MTLPLKSGSGRLRMKRMVYASGASTRRDVGVERLGVGHDLRIEMPAEGEGDVIRRHLAVALVKLDALPKLVGPGLGVLGALPALGEARAEILRAHAEGAVLRLRQRVEDLPDRPVVAAGQSRLLRIDARRRAGGERDRDRRRRRREPGRSIEARATRRLRPPSSAQESAFWRSSYSILPLLTAGSAGAWRPPASCCFHALTRRAGPCRASLRQIRAQFLSIVRMPSRRHKS